MKRLFILLNLCMAQLGCASQAVNLRICDALTQAPVPNAEVTLVISHPPKEFFGSRSVEGKKVEERKGYVFPFSYPLNQDLKCWVTVYKKGYYDTSYELNNKKSTTDSVDLTLYLNPIQKPIPLLASVWLGDDVEFDYAPHETTKRYDCLKADWLPPDGEGIKADMEFAVQRYRKDGKTFVWFKIRFTNPNDGFEEVTTPYAENMFIREAPPTKNLQNQLDFIIELHDWLPKDVPPLKNYAFRVRTQLTPSGDILSAYYGKLYQAFNFGYAAECCTCGFEYYLNPTPNDRNLEYNGRSINKPKKRINAIRYVR